MRIIKSSIAVFLCLLLNLFSNAGGSFYSAIAALICMQPELQSSFKTAMNRTIGTIVGGFVGILVLELEKIFDFNNGFPYILHAVIVSVCIIPLIYLTVKIHRNTAATITCIVFLSITIAHISDTNVVWFGIDRILETLIGIFVSLGINSIHIPHKVNKSILFATDLGGTILNENNTMNNYTKLKLNRFIKEGAKLTFFTSRSVPEIISQLEGISLQLPVIVMNGAALYDVQSHRYLKTTTIDRKTYEQIYKLFREAGLHCFVHTVLNDYLYIFYEDFNCKAEEEDYHSGMLMPMRNYICASLPEGFPILCISAMEHLTVMLSIKEKLEASHIGEDITVKLFESPDFKGYYQIEIYNKSASKLQLLKEIYEKNSVEKIAVFVRHIGDASMLSNADFGYVVERGDDLYEYTKICKDGYKRSTIKTMQKLIYSRKTKKRFKE